MDRRTFVLGAGLAALPWRFGMSPTPDDLDRSIDRVDAAYPTAAPLDTLGALRTEIPIVSRALLGARGASARRLHRVAGRARILQGNAYVDSGQTAFAERAFELAHGHGYQAGDADVVGWSYLGNAMLAQYTGQPASAGRIAELGLARCPSGPVAARLHAEGRAMAAQAVGDGLGARHALDEAWRITDMLAPAEPGWRLDYYTSAELCEVASAALDSTSPHDALAYAAVAEPELDRAGATGHRSYVRLNRASALIETGDLDAAESAVHDALTVSAARRVADVGDVAGRLSDRISQRRAAPHLARRVHAWRTGQPV